MLGQYLITFREALEAALITAIILSYLNRTSKHHLTRYVWYGVILAATASSVVGVSIFVVYSALDKLSQLLFEAATAFLAVIVLSSMIYWMMIKGKSVKQEMEKRIEVATAKGAIVGLVSVVFIVVFREGLETVLFLTPFVLEDAISTFIGGAAGLITSSLLAYGIFMAGMKISLRNFFYFTSILLILLAGGLAGYGTHELIEYYKESGVQLGYIAEPAYSLGIPSDNPLHHKGLVGSVFAVMFGYSVNPEWGRIVVHFTYLMVMLPLVVWLHKKEE